MTITKNLFDFPALITKEGGSGSTVFDMSFNGTYTISFDIYCPKSDYYGNAACCEIFVDGKEIDILFPSASQNGFVTITRTITGNLTKIVFSSYGLESNAYVYYKNIQLEEGSTATSYVPYGYLPMYKGRYKVSNVCQLLDKSKYPATQTINGVTFTNNGDGTITVNGTATANSTFNLIYKANSLTIIDHKYLLIGCPEGGNTSSTYFLRYDSDGGTAAFDIGSGVIFTRTNEKYAYINMRILASYTANNLTFKPQLFDLTEMYGAGNEPTTVAEFREKFPDDLYPYSPYCWAKIKSLIYKDNIDYIKMK